MTKVKVLHSKTTKRVIAPSASGGSITMIFDEKPADLIHAAPTDIDTMSESFSNREISDWEEKNITKWDDLNQ